MKTTRELIIEANEDIKRGIKYKNPVARFERGILTINIEGTIIKKSISFFENDERLKERRYYVRGRDLQEDSNGSR